MVPTKMAKEGTWGTRQKYQTIKITKTLVKTVRSNLIRNLDNIVKDYYSRHTKVGQRIKNKHFKTAQHSELVRWLEGS